MRFRNELSARLENCSLSLHETKTRLIRFGRFAASQRRERGLGKPSTFNFIGFTHICGKDQNGRFVLLRRTQRERLRTKLKVIRERLMRLRHLPVSAQGRWLASVVRGHFAYYGVPTNIHALQAFRTQVERHWRHALRRRGQRDRTTWNRVRTLSARWIPSPRIVHPWPSTGFDGRTRGRKPSALAVHAGNCAGGGLTRFRTAKGRPYRDLKMWGAARRLCYGSRRRANAHEGRNLARSSGADPSQSSSSSSLSGANASSSQRTRPSNAPHARGDASSARTRSAITRPERAIEISSPASTSRSSCDRRVLASCTLTTLATLQAWSGLLVWLSEASGP